MLTNQAKRHLCRVAARSIRTILRWLQQQTGDSITAVLIERDRDALRADAGKMHRVVIVDMSEGANL